MNIESIREKYTEALMRFPNVVGVGIGEKLGQPVIKVLVTRKVPKSELQPPDLLPERLEGYEIDVEAIGLPMVY